MNTANIVLCVFYWIIFVIAVFVHMKSSYSFGGGAIICLVYGLTMGAFIATIYSFGSMA
uniref:Uncharacterized protein n=1 Tax=viral metagenome TaxID=1070528 RepID=A0A6C0HP75_9ZZZZ